MIKTSLSQQLEQLETQLSSTKNKKEQGPLERKIYFLKIKIERKNAYKRLNEGDRVTFRGRTGTILEKYIANGGFPSLWVLWDADPEREDKKGIIYPEDPRLMTLLN